MSTIISDAFPGPTLDSTKWTLDTDGGASINVGTPDGVYPQNVNDDGDYVDISSIGKIRIPANASFSMQINYQNVGVDPSESLNAYLGWRSKIEYGSVKRYGVDVILHSRPDSSHYFQYRAMNHGATYRGNIVKDPNSGADGGLYLARAGSVYELGRIDGSGAVTILTSLNVGTPDEGFIVFGLFAETYPTQGIPWIA